MVPNGWSIESLGNVTEKVGSGVTPRGGSNSYKLSGIPLIRSQNVLWGKLDLSDVAYIDELQHNKMKGSFVYKNDVLLNITGASIGRVAVSDIDEANVNQHVCIIRSDDLDSGYLKSFLLSFQGQKQIEQCQAGGNRQGLNFEQIKSFKIPFPHLPEQQKIAKILSTWDNAISTTERLIENSTQQKKALMQQLLTGKKRLFDDEERRFKGEWEEYPVGEICQSIVPGRNKPKKFDGHIPWVTTPEFQGRYIPSKLQKNYISQSVIDECGAKLVPKGAVVIAAVGDLGLTAMASEIIVLNQQLHAFVCGENVYNEYLFYWLSYQKPYMESIASKTTIQYMNKKNCESIPVKLPTLEEQQKIASVLTNADKEIELLEQQLADLQQEKKALMQVLLTGKRRVLVDGEVA